MWEVPGLQLHEIWARSSGCWLDQVEEALRTGRDGESGLHAAVATEEMISQAMAFTAPILLISDFQKLKPAKLLPELRGANSQRKLLSGTAPPFHLEMKLSASLFHPPGNTSRPSDDPQSRT